MRLFIPACGDRLNLKEPWSFDLYLERRNMAFAMKLGLVNDEVHKLGGRPYCVWDGEPYRSGYKKVRVTLGAGDVVECDRVYIRTFSKSALVKDVDYDSITWKLIRNGKAVPHGRFWVKLPDAYGISYELGENALYRDRVKLVKGVMAE